VSSLQLSALVQMTASACSKLVASTATYPHEVIRSHMHISGIASLSGFVGVCKEASHFFVLALVAEIGRAPLPQCLSFTDHYSSSEGVIEPSCTLNICPVAGHEG